MSSIFSLPFRKVKHLPNSNSKFGFKIANGVWGVHDKNAVALLRLLGLLGIIKSKKYADASSVNTFGKYLR